jgi:hypothetical protein
MRIMCVPGDFRGVCRKTWASSPKIKPFILSSALNLFYEDTKQLFSFQKFSKYQGKNSREDKNMREKNQAQ